jgi:WD40 repeat protein
MTKNDDPPLDNGSNSNNNFSISKSSKGSIIKISDLITRGKDLANEILSRPKIISQSDAIRSFGGINDRSCVAYSLDGRYIVIRNYGMYSQYGRSDFHFTLWDSETGFVRLLSIPHSTIKPGFWDHIYSVAISYDAKRIASGQAMLGGIHLWDLDKEKEIEKFNPPSDIEFVVALEFSPDGNLIAACSKQGLSILEADTGRELFRFEGQFWWFTQINFSLNDKYLACGSPDSDLRIIDFNNGKVIETFSHHNGIESVVLSNDGSKALSGCEDGSIQLWELGQNSCLKHLWTHGTGVRRESYIYQSQEGKFTKHKYLVSKKTSVAISSDNNLALSACIDGNTVILWKIPDGTGILFFNF